MKSHSMLLITSAGKRVSLIKCFQNISPLLKVAACDQDVFRSPACLVAADYFAVPNVNDAGYISFLENLCEKKKISIIIPTIDTELEILSQNKERFERKGIHIIVSDLYLIQICHDKRKSSQWLKSLGFRVPKIRSLGDEIFPIFTKPYDGSLSNNTHIIRRKEDLIPSILNDPKMIYLEYIDPEYFTEFTVDMYFGRDHRIKSIVPRERLKVRAGEINQGFTVKNEIVSYVYDRMKHIPGMVGCVCLQLFFNKNTKEIIAFELNPRFGGGYPLSYYAGANYPKWIIEEYLEGRTIDYDDSWDDGTMMLRYDAEVIVKNGSLIKK